MSSRCPQLIERLFRWRRQHALLDRGGIGVGQGRPDSADDAAARGGQLGRVRPMEFRDARQDPQVLQQLPVLVVLDRGLELRPVDVDRAVGDGGGKFEQSGALRAHG